MLESSAFTPLAGPSTPCLNAGIPCYLPYEIQAAYNYPSGVADPTFSSTFSPLYLDVLRRGGTVLASAGDLGASDGTELESLDFPDLHITPSAMAAYPASDPLVLAVGGTEGNPYPDGLLTDAGT